MVDLLINLYCRTLPKGVPWYLGTCLVYHLIATINPGMAIAFLLVMQGLCQYIHSNLTWILGHLPSVIVYLVINILAPNTHKSPYIPKWKRRTSDWLRVRFKALVTCCVEKIMAPIRNMKTKRRERGLTSHQHNQH